MSAPQVGFRRLYLADAAVVVGTIVVTNILRFGALTPGTYPAWQYAVGYAVATVVHLVVYYFGGLYEPEQRLGLRPWLPRAASQTFVAILIESLGAFLTGRYLIPRPNLVVLLVVVSVGVTANRRIARTLRWRRYGRPRVLLVGDRRDIARARAHLPTRDRAAVVVGEVATADDLLDEVRASGATDVLLLSPGLADDVFPEPLTTLDRTGIGVLYRVTGRETILGLQAVREVSGMPFVPLRVHTLPQSRARFKRFLELGAVLVLSPLLLIAVLLAVTYVLVVAGRPVLYKQTRAGRDGKAFRMLKLRTMTRDAERETGAVLAAERDPRVVRGCGWLRRSRIDELPQLWNVVRGEMSIVGPRPERPELIQQFEREIPGYARRQEIPPGITGLAQVRGRYHTDPEFKLGYDLQYLVNWSPILDAEILVQTVWVVLSGRV